MEQKVYPMTAEQESLWIDDHLGSGQSRYVESWVCRLTGPVSVAAVDWAVGQIVDRHEALRSAFVLNDDELIQVVSPPGGHLGIPRVACAPAALEAELRAIVSRPMDLSASPVRATLLELRPDDVVLVLQVHHIAVDEWALHVLEREFESHYRAWVEQRPAELPPPCLQPGQYAISRRSTPPDPAVLAYWRDRLRDPPADQGRTIEPDLPSRPGGGHQGAEVRFLIGIETGRRIRTLCRTLRVTPFVVLVSVLGLLLAARNGTSDVIVGTPVSRRGTVDLDQMIAYLTEILPVRLAVHLDGTFADLVALARAAVSELMVNKDISYSELVRQTRRRGGSRLCRTVIVLDDGESTRLDLPGIEAERLYVHPGIAKFDLCFTCVAQGGGYRVFLEYSTDLFLAQTAESVAEEFHALLDAVTREPGRPLAGITAAVLSGSQQPTSPAEAPA